MTSNQDDYRVGGYKKLKLKDYAGALECFNRALLASGDIQDEEATNIERAMCYGDRATTYLEMKYFEHCLHNIELESHYSGVTIQNRMVCLLREQNSADRVIEPVEKNLFKLSYEPNPKLPFFVDALELKEDHMSGKHIITNRDLRAGDVIAIIEDCWIMENRKIRSCANCLSVNNLDLMFFDDCKKALFCSESCHDEHLKLDRRVRDTIEKVQHYQDNEAKAELGFDVDVKVFLKFCGAFESIAEMKQFVDDHSEKTYSIFDFDLSDKNDPLYMKHMLLIIMGLDKTYQILRPSLVYKKGSIRKSLRLIIKEPNDYLMKIFETNEQHLDFIDEVFMNIRLALVGFWPLRMSIDEDYSSFVGSYFHPSSLLVYCSCDPNTKVLSFAGKRAVWIVNRPMKAGDQILLGRTPYHRQKIDNVTPICQISRSCVPCKYRWGESINAKRVKKLSQETFTKHQFIFGDRAYAPRIMKILLDECVADINMNFDSHKYETDADHREIIATKLNEFHLAAQMITQPFFNPDARVNFGKKKNPIPLFDIILCFGFLFLSVVAAMFILKVRSIDLILHLHT